MEANNVCRCNVRPDKNSLLLYNYAYICMMYVYPCVWLWIFTWSVVCFFDVRTSVRRPNGHFFFVRTSVRRPNGHFSKKKRPATVCVPATGTSTRTRSSVVVEKRVRK